MLFMTKKATLGLVLSLVLSSDLYIASTSAQTPAPPAPPAPAPTNTTAPAPAKPKVPPGFVNLASAAGSKYIYYHGGTINQGGFAESRELWGVDITKSWHISTPSWTNLTSPGGTVAGPPAAAHSATMSKDGSTFIITAPTENAATGFLYMYNTGTSTWSSVPAPAA
ncbi:hypothetical protein BGZ94_005719, partial [Podila epigama]